ncbi:MAG: YHYH protein, partial [Bacteroidota bacterium]
LGFVNEKFRNQGLFSLKRRSSLLGLVVLVLSLACVGQKQQFAGSLEFPHSSIPDSLTNPDHYFGAYFLHDAAFGTNTQVSIQGNQRVIVTNAIPNHSTGQFPNAGNPNAISAQRSVYRIPLQAQFTGQANWARVPGVALNGVKFEPETAEVVRCESGENYRVEAIQNLFDLGLDFNHAHVQPTGAYHYHGPPTGVIAAFDQGEDVVHIGFALDGFPIYYSKSGRYQPSYRIIEESHLGTNCHYSNPMEHRAIELDGTRLDGTFVSDWEYVNGLGDLDECNGIRIDGQYQYFVTDTYPYVGRCLKGIFKESRRGVPPPGGRPPQGHHLHKPHRH